jgi:diacylglycerol O-acyltransferase / wax synthase
VLSPVDRAWWRMESPTNLMMITAVLGFDRVPDVGRLRDRARALVEDIPRLRQRVEDGARRRPRWVNVPDLDIEALIRHRALEGEGDEVAQEHVSRLMSTPLDRRGPLWAIDLLEAPSGKGVAVARLHHSIGDGLVLMLALLALADLAPTDGPEDNPLAHLFRPGADLEAARACIRELFPGGLELMRRRAGRRRTLDPRKVARGFGSALELVRLPAEARGPLRGELHERKRAAWSRGIPLTHIKELAAGLGCTINDVMTALVAGGLRRYLQRERGAPALDLRAAVPINLRGIDDMAELGNRFGLLFMPLPVEIDDPLARVAEARRRLDALKGSPEPVVTFALLRMLGAGPARLEDRVVDLFASKITAVMTNVPGPVRPLYLAGAPIRSLIFWVPQTARVGLGISVSSYAGTVWIGVASDAGLIDEPASLVACIEEELDEFPLPPSFRPDS